MIGWGEAVMRVKLGAGLGVGEWAEGGDRLGESGEDLEPLIEIGDPPRPKHVGGELDKRAGRAVFVPLQPPFWAAWTDPRRYSAWIIFSRVIWSIFPAFVGAIGMILLYTSCWTCVTRLSAVRVWPSISETCCALSILCTTFVQIFHKGVDTQQLNYTGTRTTGL